jgi:hypothetical protein
MEGGRIDLGNGPAGEVEIVLGTGTGQIDGTVRPPAPLPPGVTAILVSADGVTANTGARSAAIDQAGRFQFRFVPPGRYFVLSATDFDEDLWQNMEFVQQIRERGVSVDVAAKGTASVEVPILEAADLRHAIEKVPR